MKYLIANWKMNHTVNQGIQFLDELFALNPSSDSTCLIIAPPFTSLYSLSQKIKQESLVVSLSAQNMSQFKMGAYTGEVSAEMIIDAGSKYVLVGHSERRHVFHETNETITQKFDLALEYRLIPILCFGEILSVYQAKETVSYLRNQLLPFQEKKPPILAYEPVWAIGSGLIPSIEEIETVIGFVKQLFPESCVLYGGSVNPETMTSIASISSLDGFLVGGASLQANTFYNLILAMEKASYDR
jgi:triosephosphate isomerase